MNQITDMQASGARGRRGFTIMEVLVVVGILALLLGLAVATFQGVIGGARTTKTEYILSTIGQSVELFYNDFNYYPPLLEDNWRSPDERLTSLTARVTGQGATENPLTRARYHSIFTLPIYLTGQGDINGDMILTYNPDAADADPSDAKKRNLDDGNDGPGLRDPGPDKVWGAARRRITANVRPPTSGRVYGPYIDMESDTVVRRARIDPFSEEGSDFPPSFEDAELMEREGLFVFQDPWGKPIRYYRNWPTTVTGTTDEPSLNRIPIELVKPQALLISDEPDPSSDPELMRAPYALLSAGEDGFFGDRHSEGTPDEDHEDQSDFIWAEDFADLDGSGDMLAQNELISSQGQGRLADNVRHTP